MFLGLPPRLPPVLVWPPAPPVHRNRCFRQPRSWLPGAGLAVALALVACRPPAPPAPLALPPPRACFILHEIGVGTVRRAPDEACATRVTPASTFKIAHALTGLDAGLLGGPDHPMKHDGRRHALSAWNGDQTLTTAMKHSVLWYFEALARALGPERERAYAARLGYGNADTSGRLTSFWIGGRLAISPDEQEAFLVRLYTDALPVSRAAQAIVRETLIQPPGEVWSGLGAHPFVPPWPPGTVLAAKTGRYGSDDGKADVRWLVGHVDRGRRRFVFVSCVAGAKLPHDAAITLAASSLRAAGVL